MNDTATPAANTEIPKGPRERTIDRPAAATKPEPTAKRKANKKGLVTVQYTGARFTPMKYEVYADGSMQKLTFGKSSQTAQVTPAVADVLTGKTPQKYDGKQPINAVVALGKISDSSGERWTEVV